MKANPDLIRFDGTIERIAPEVPRFIVYSGKAWDETGIFIVDVSLNGIPVGLRNLLPWKERGWHVGLSESICRKLGIDTGNRVRVEMRRLGDDLPQELRELLKNNASAERASKALPAGEIARFCAVCCRCQEDGDARLRRARRLLAN